MSSTLSILGLYEWDNTIFDGLEVPQGLAKELLVSNLLMELAELEVIYPDPVFMKSAITVWSAKMIGTWNRLYEALSEEYNPIHNYDRTETRTENESGSNSTTSSDSSVGNNLSKVTGYNSDTMVDNGSTDSTITGTAQANSTNSILRSYSLRAFGNIGVTTNATMLEEEIDIRQRFNIYDLMTMDFKERFCLLIY